MRHPDPLRRGPLALVVTGDYNEGMKTAGVRELKAHLSGYLRDVERGDVVLVTDRGRVIAELRSPGSAERELSPGDLRYRKLVADGLLRPAAARASAEYGFSRLHCTVVGLREFLRERRRTATTSERMALCADGD